MVTFFRDRIRISDICKALVSNKEEEKEKKKKEKRFSVSNIIGTMNFLSILPWHLPIGVKAMIKLFGNLCDLFNLQKSTNMSALVCNWSIVVGIIR